MLEIHTLGRLSIRDGGSEVTELGSRKAQAILVYLAVEGGVHPRSTLASLFWPESPESNALASLRVAISALKKNVGKNLEISQNSIGMKKGTRLYLDVFDLETYLAKKQVDKALEIYRGDFLQSFFVQGAIEFEDWRLWESERLRKKLISAMQNAVSNEIGVGNHKRAQDLSRQLLKLDNLNEFAHHQYMLALALDGQRTTALKHYSICRETLLQELGVRPSKEIKILHNEIQQGEITVQPKQFLSGHNLPSRRTSFIGREGEVFKLSQLLENTDCRVITLVGPGGSGKTRLALEVASEIWGKFEYGAYFVPLERVSSSAYLVSAIAEAIHFNLDDHISETDPIKQLLDFISTRSILLILDGYEHLLPDVQLFEPLLSYCSLLKILVTSRQKLNLKSESIFHIQGLLLADNQGEKADDLDDSLQLFKDRAKQASIGFSLSESELPHATRVCRLVDGMPLGIELAATWTPVLTCREIADEIEKDLDFLETNMPDLPEGHRSLRVVFDRSWEVLNDDLQIALARLSIFRGGFNRRGARQIADVNLFQLSGLFNRSLLIREHGGRMDMHRSIQQYAFEKLRMRHDQWVEVNDKHASFFSKFLSDRVDDLMGAGMVLSRAEIRQDIENVRAAMGWAIANWDQESITGFAYNFFVFLVTNGWHLGILEEETIIRLIQTNQRFQSETKPPILLALEVQKAFLLSNLGRYEESEAICQENLEPIRRLEMKGELSACIHNLGLNAIFIGEIENAIKMLSQAVDLGRESGYLIWPSYYLWLGYAYYLLGEYEKGWENLAICNETYESWGSSWGSAFALSKMGLAADGLGQHDTAMQYHQEALEIFEETGDQAGRAYCLSRMSTASYFLADYDQAAVYGLEGYKEFQKIGHRFGLYLSQCRLAFAYIGSGDISQAAISLYQVLEETRKHDMVQLTLYALAGLSCALVIVGEERLGIRVFSIIKQHPKLPPLYIDVAQRWFRGFEKELDEMGEPFDESLMAGLIEEVVKVKHKLMMHSSLD